MLLTRTALATIGRKVPDLTEYKRLVTMPRQKLPDQTPIREGGFCGEQNAMLGLSKDTQEYLTNRLIRVR